MRTRTPEPVHDRKNVDVQTELYLEELSDRIEEADVDVQTDAFLDRPPSPLFIPQSTGKDIATQIEAGDVKNLHLYSNHNSYCCFSFSYSISILK